MDSKEGDSVARNFGSKDDPHYSSSRSEDKADDVADPKPDIRNITGTRPRVEGKATEESREFKNAGDQLESKDELFDSSVASIVSGLRINWMNMRDGQSSEIMWQVDWDETVFDEELQESIPKSILDCSTVSRELNFSSREVIRNFRIQQKIFFLDKCIEEWNFVFGYVIPGSTNTWQQLIVAAPKEEMLTAEVLSGNVRIETRFYDADTFLCRNVVRIVYV